MKKKSLWTTLLLIVVCTCIFSACGKEESHIHTYESAWSYDAQNHWHKATCEHSSEKSELAVHSFTDDVCTVCNYENGTSVPDNTSTYTVIFDANLGSFNDGQFQQETIAQGALLTAPEEPIRDGFAFLGWSTSVDGSILWDFSSNQVTENLTLYAVWAEEVSVTLNANGGVFVTGDEIRAETLAKGGTLISVETPTRVGYMFNGWWLSGGNTDGGQILYQKYDATQTIDSDELYLYAEWIELPTNTKQLPSPLVKIEEDRFSWDSVSGAEGYNIQVFKDNDRIDNIDIHTTNWTFPSNYASGFYKVEIKALGNGNSSLNSPSVIKNYANRILAEISSVNFNANTSILSWTPVTQAEQYELYINNELVKVLSDPSYDMSGYQAGIYQIEIIAKKDDCSSPKSSETIEKKRLKTPSVEIFADNENGTQMIKWDSIDYADKYIIDFGVKKIEIVGEISYVFDNSAEFWNGNNACSFTMIALDFDNKYYESQSTEIISVKKLYSLTLENDLNAGTITTVGSVYKPQSFVVEFNLNGATGKIPTQTVSATTALNYPSVIPTRNGYVFRGWFEDAACTKLYNFSQTINADTMLYAGWQEISSVGKGNYILDITTSCNSSSSYFSANTADTSSSNCIYIYFAALESGTYKFNYKNSSSNTNYGVYTSIQNVTKSTSVLDNSNLTASSYTLATEFSAEAGDVFCVCIYRANSNYSSTLRFYIEGGNIPESGGLGENRYLIKGSEDTIQNITNIKANVDTPIVITATSIDDRYVFLGWYDGETKLTEEFSYSFVMPNENACYTAKWICYSVTTEKNLELAGSITHINNEAVKEGDEVTISATTNSGYTWLGWYDGETLLTNDLTFAFTMPAKNVVYTAKWIPCPVIIEKNLNDAGTVTGMKDVTCIGEKITVEATTNDGYTWLGWYNGNDLITDESTLTFSIDSQSITYTAKWACYTLSTNTNESNGGNYTTHDSTKTVLGELVTIKAETNSGYTWLGWYDGETLLTSDLNYTFTMPAKSVVYTAKWISCPVTIEKNLNDAGTVTGMKDVTCIGEKITVEATTNDGYTWLGWYNGETLLTSDLEYTFTITTESVTYTATWEAITYNVTLDTQSGTIGGESSLSVKMGASIILPTPSRTGYKFDGWYTESGTRVTDDSNSKITWNITEDITLIAKWLRPINFDCNGGNAISTIYAEPGSSIQLPSATKTGHTLSGWNYNSTLYSGTYTVPDEEITFVASWTANTYRIYYNGTSIQVTYGEWYNIPTPTKDGYEFRYFTISGYSTTQKFSSYGTYTRTSDLYLSCKWVKNLSTTVSGAKTISCSSAYLEDGMTFTITYSGSTMKCFKIDTNVPVNVVFVGTGYSYSNDTSCGVNSHGGSTTMTIRITIPDASKVSGTFTCKFTCTTYIQSGEGY